MPKNLSDSRAIDVARLFWGNRSIISSSRMPHIHLVTSADLAENMEIPQVLAALVGELSAQESIHSAAIKAYHSLKSVWAMGEGAPGGFAHCEVRILAGRPPDLRKKVADAMYSRMRKLFEGSLREGAVSLTLEVREMDAEAYRK